MDFIPVSYSAAAKRRARKLISGWIALGAGIPAIASALVFMDGSLSKGEMPPLFLSCGFIMVGLFGAFMETELQQERLQSERNSELRSSLNEHYGLKLSKEEFAGLGYPAVEPSSDFEVFGSFLHQERSSESSFVERKIYLVSMDGELKLSSSKDGKNFRELKPVQRKLAISKPTEAQPLSAISARGASLRVDTPVVTADRLPGSVERAESAL